MITTKDKIDIVIQRGISLYEEYDRLNAIIVERNDGMPGSKEWCLEAQKELIDIRLKMEALAEQLEILEDNI
jgi:hypothetical protein